MRVRRDVPAGYERNNSAVLRCRQRERGTPAVSAAAFGGMPPFTGGMPTAATSPFTNQAAKCDSPNLAVCNTHEQWLSQQAP